MKGKNNKEFKNFESIKIGLASTEKILSWSHGEVTLPETINYRTQKPEPDGLFCEKIFGPQKDWECYCGRYKKIRDKGVVCERCGVEITKSKVRRERMGHIELATPVSHIWYFKGVPSKMGLIMEVTPKNLERVLYFAAYIVLEPGNTIYDYKEVITEKQYYEAVESDENFRAGTGAEAVREILCNIDLPTLATELREELKTKLSTQKKTKVVRRLEVVEAFLQSGNKPEWMILEVLPVIPPDIRPMIQLDGGRFATSDLNDLYRRVINRNNRLKKLLSLGAPSIIVRNEKRMLQEAVDALIDNGRRGKAVTGAGSRPLKSLSEMLKGKQGRFRQNLLGKRVDYSGRSVIVVGPELRFWQCGLPKNMALELFKPFIMKKLIENGKSLNIKNAKKMVERMDSEVWDILDEVIQEHPVMLNRAPTLHRLGIQAFEPVLVDGKAIKLHPLVCTAFNADFDGDQMAVHVPLSVEAQAEARFLMLSTNNILAPKDGSPITTPTQDMILGSYYLTHPGSDDRNSDDTKGDGMIFSNYDEMIMAYQSKKVGIHANVGVRMYAGENDKIGKVVKSTVGRFIFNREIPQDLGFVTNRKEDPYSLEVDFLCDKKKLGEIIDKCFRVHGNAGTVLMLDAIKDMGFHYSTKAAITISIADMEIPEAKEEILDKAQKAVDEYEQFYLDGLLSDEERYERVCNIWTKATDDVADELMDTLDSLNNLFIMAHSGARGSKKQISQVGGMRGLMANATGKTIEIPIKANFREGLSVLDYFVSSNGARKGLADTAIRTADSGYLTRRLVDVAHNIIVREDDCHTDEGVKITAFVEGVEVIENLRERIIGRAALNDIVNPKNNKVICEGGAEITEDIADEIVAAGIEEVYIRSVMTCKSKRGVCAKCYGRNLATGSPVNIGESVGITAAQSIGEPGTQLTMRTFHSGGVAGADITQGLPRVEELFEARMPKGLAEICRGDGTVTSIEAAEDNKTNITVKQDNGEEAIYTVPHGARKNVVVGDRIYQGDGLTSGPLNPHDILTYKGVQGVYEYLLKEVRKVYKSQSVTINDKHIEVIVSKMLSKVMVEDPGDTTLLPDMLYDKREIELINKQAIEEGKEPAVYHSQLRGITKASLETDSFLSAASFQETTKVLTDAAIKGKVDHLVGLKENVIIGKLVPAGTGMSRYRDISIDYGKNSSTIEAWEREKKMKEMMRAAEAGELNNAEPEQATPEISTPSSEDLYKELLNNVIDEQIEDYTKKNGVLVDDDGIHIMND
ncbi:MAG: DNA-directed RNA polymerase subunit beta' [Eubacteriales bacterium]|nr:DNA-directed RNA polymerase subunit beta' [Eubacteriales bacterium]MDY3333246.1 DNA-directed RNA polymerase subunit beta' [Gallibacter sp.]